MAPSCNLMETTYDKIICLHGSSCNSTTGRCDGCPPYFTDDNTVFLGNNNCGMSVIYAGFVYIFTILFALFVATLGWKIAQSKSPGSKVRKMLYLTILWSCLIPCYILAHFLEGYRHGPVAAALFTIVSMLVNTQVAILGYILWSFMAVVCNAWTQKFIYRASVVWYMFWMSMKIGVGIVMVFASAQNQIDLFNRVQMVSVCALYIEITCNVFLGWHNASRMVSTMEQLRSDAKVTAIKDVVVDFVEKVKKTKNIQPCFGFLFLIVATILIVLLAIFGGAVPYQFILWSLALMIWPLLGLGPVLRARGKLAEHLDKNNNHPQTSDVTLKQPRDIQQQQYRNQVAMDGSLVVFPSNTPLVTSLEVDLENNYEHKARSNEIRNHL